MRRGTTLLWWGSDVGFDLTDLGHLINFHQETLRGPMTETFGTTSPSDVSLATLTLLMTTDLALDAWQSSPVYSPYPCFIYSGEFFSVVFTDKVDAGIFRFCTRPPTSPFSTPKNTSDFPKNHTAVLAESHIANGILLTILWVSHDQIYARG